MQPSEGQTPENWQQPEAPQAEYHPTVSQPVPQAPAEPATSVPVTDPALQESPLEDVASDEMIPESDDETTMQPEGDEELIRWEATEYIHRDRPPMWYVVLAIVVVVLIAAAIFLIQSITFAILVPVMAAALIVYTRRPPAHIQYTLSRKGLHANDKLFTYDMFRAFSVMTHDGHNTIMLIPRKRFALGEMVYFPDEVGETVVDMLAARLPMKDAKPDIVDRIIARLKL